ncbi:hypothetical protein SFRURICE_001201, partial [Spodoptera frugiperda]
MDDHRENNNCDVSNDDVITSQHNKTYENHREPTRITENLRESPRIYKNHREPTRINKKINEAGAERAPPVSMAVSAQPHQLFRESRISL